MIPSREQQALVHEAGRALSRAGLVHAYGHCSLRLDAESFLVSAPVPLRLLEGREGMVVRLDAPLPVEVLGEVRLHREIYRRRSDVGGICRAMPPVLVALSTQGIVPRPRHGLGAYFHQLPFWDDPALLRDDSSAARAAQALGNAPALVLRGNGMVAVGENLSKAVVLTWLLEDTARVEREVRSMGFDPEQGLMTPAEISARNVWAGAIAERMWSYLTQDCRPGDR